MTTRSYFNSCEECAKQTLTSSQPTLSRDYLSNSLFSPTPGNISDHFTSPYKGDNRGWKNASGTKKPQMQNLLNTTSRCWFGWDSFVFCPFSFIFHLLSFILKPNFSYVPFAAKTFYGTSTRFNTLRITSSLVISSASAS